MRALVFVCICLLFTACAAEVEPEPAAPVGSGLGGKLDEGAASDTSCDPGSADVAVAVEWTDTSGDTTAADTTEADTTEADVPVSGPCDAGPEVEEPVEDMWAIASDVTVHHVIFPEGSEVPASYDYPYGGDVGFSLGGTEFWQKWSGGENPTYSYGDGSPNGKRCMYASARRWEAIMAVVPEALVQLRDESNWGGSFFNWNDDYSNDSWGDGNGARLWAWRTSMPSAGNVKTKKLP